MTPTNTTLPYGAMDVADIAYNAIIQDADSAFERTAPGCSAATTLGAPGSGGGTGKPSRWIGISDGRRDS